MPTRDSLAGHRGSDVFFPEGGTINFLRKFIHRMDIITPTTPPKGDLAVVTTFPGDPKIVFPRMTESGAPTLIGDTRDYAEKHGDQLPSLLESSEFSERFFAIVREIVDTFNNMIAVEPDKIKEQLQSQAGFRIFLDSLEHPLSAASAPIDENMSLSSHQQVFTDKREGYLRLLETYIKDDLQPNLVENHFLETDESLDVFLGDAYPDGGKFADFKIVKNIRLEIF